MITKFKLFESFSEPLFKNESKLKDLLMKDEDFTKGEICYGITNIGYEEWNTHKEWRYDDMLRWITDEFGKVSRFCVLFSAYNGQVCNGGHVQYYDNGYASARSEGCFGNYEDCEKHDDMVELFNELDLDKLPLGQKAYDVMSKFEVDLDDEVEQCGNCGGNGEAQCDTCKGNGTVDCETCGGSGEDSEGEECTECNGNGNVDCDDCDGAGQEKCSECDGDGEYKTGNKVPDTKYWERLDSEWYEINEDFMKQLNAYLGELTLDGEKIGDIVELARQSKKYNV